MVIVACIPAFNEAGTIGDVIENTLNFVDKVIVVDDGSVDNTLEIARDNGAYVVRHEFNQGKGVALKTGFMEALKHDPDVVIVLDGDGQHDPSDIPKFLDALETGGLDAVIGSRYHEGSVSNAPVYRRFGLGVLRVVSSLDRSNGVEDTQSGFRAFRKNAVDVLLGAREAGYNIEMEQIKILVENNVAIGEVPIRVNYDVPYPSKKNPLEHGLELLGYMINLMIVKRPLLYLGLPGGIFFLFGVGFFVWFLNQFNETGYFSIPLAIISMGLLLFGMLLVTNSFVLHSIQSNRKVLN